jgi:hypothetical protein
VLTKPNVGAVTKADEMISGTRPYISLITPLATLDWEWSRAPAGNYYLTYFKYMEDTDKTHIITIKEWYPDRIVTSTVDTNDRATTGTVTEPNGLGFVPVTIAYSQRSPKRGIGISEIDDIADFQRAIYNEYSEVEQTIRISGHPSLVKTPDTEAVAGAGSIVQMPDNLDPGLKPYLLQPSGQNVSAIYESIRHRIEAIDKMANLGSARALRTGAAMSGVAMETEFQMLNARLSDKADNLQLVEENIWYIWCSYQGVKWDGEINYPDTFQIQDKKNELTALTESRKTVTNPEYLKMLDYEIMSTALGNEDFVGYLEDPMMYQEPQPVASSINEVQQAALGLTNQQVMALAGNSSATSGAPTTNFNNASCPVATQDIGVNLANRQKAIDTANYGPLNPALPNRTFWLAKADMWNTDVATVKQSRCGNCSFFNMKTSILDCIDSGLAAGGATGDEWDSIGGGQLGYCEAFDFKCKSTRSCDAWVAGGPITDSTTSPTQGQ